MTNTDNLTLEQRLDLLREQHHIVATDLAKIEGAIETVESIIAQVRRDQQRRADEAAAKLLEAKTVEAPVAKTKFPDAPKRTEVKQSHKKRATLRPNK